ncbi:AbrB/MazE/SpoVT family DNA-binding domain-containing protein [uncultured Methanobrevibacter sp.]|uniref:AbrB/MazE/SpoVT family DNA-binding domain-containing protein n=1 Tax=uncultured Methanobrevibacter sp. TaxID=253161 RepID=UPI0025F759E4|nr:AbrB/MazE/SpoVT family DNA-binding domain-containing protein [uncultured Methanobrevibacter sp.]
MENIVASTKLYKNFQVVIPKEIRKEYDFDIDNTMIDWCINKDNEIVLIPREKITTKDILGIVKDKDKWDIDKEVYE